MISLPSRPETPNVTALASVIRERLTGLSTATVTLTKTIVAGTEQVYKNGTLVDPTTYTILGNVVTLGSSLSSGDVVVVRYNYRSS